jgi:hypothetical protein
MSAWRCELYAQFHKLLNNPCFMQFPGFKQQQHKQQHQQATSYRSRPKLIMESFVLINFHQIIGIINAWKSFINFLRIASLFPLQ